MDIYASGFAVLRKKLQPLRDGAPVDWGRRDAVTITPLNFEPGAVYLQEDDSETVHRIEQANIPVVAGEPCTVEVVARA
ncbi:MAG: hypothetical protein WAN06_16420, partial [Candidatus Sulfotelmatobacter sp.]